MPSVNDVEISSPSKFEPEIGYPTFAPPKWDYFEDNPILSGIGDLLDSVSDTVGTIAEFTKSAFEGATQILESISNFFSTYDFMFGFFPSEVEVFVFSIFSIMVTVITFKVVGYFT